MFEVRRPVGQMGYGVRDLSFTALKMVANIRRLQFILAVLTMIVALPIGVVRNGNTNFFLRWIYYTPSICSSIVVDPLFPPQKTSDQHSVEYVIQKAKISILCSSYFKF